MKELAAFETPVGGDGATAKGALGVSGDMLEAQVAVKYPIAKIVEPAAKVIDDVIDKVEQWIPGDQVGMAAQLKSEARARLVAMLSEDVAG